MVLCYNIAIFLKMLRALEINKDLAMAKKEQVDQKIKNAACNVRSAISIDPWTMCLRKWVPSNWEILKIFRHCLIRLISY
jgi:hypothetical protein